MDRQPKATDQFLATLSEVIQIRQYLVTLAVQAITAGAARWWLAHTTWIVLGLFGELPFSPTFVGDFCLVGPLAWSASAFWNRAPASGGAIGAEQKSRVVARSD